MIDVEFRDRACYFPGADVLVCSDLHLGRDATSAIQVPLGERRDVVGRLRALCDRFTPAEVVLAGDVLHSFSGTPGNVAESFDGVVREVEAQGARVTITPGNHDAMLGGLWSGRAPAQYRIDPDGKTTDSESIVVCHGHELPDGNARTYVIGHDHPAIEIEGRRRPCYLYGPDAYGGADVLMLPAFTRLAAGVPVNGLSARDFQSPLVTDLEGFRPIVRDETSDETLWFPPLGEFRSML